MSGSINDRAIEILAALGHTVTADLPRAAVAQQIAAELCDLFDADYCRYWWRTEDEAEVRVIAHHPPIEFKEEWEYLKRLDSPKNSIVKRIFVDGKLLIEPDAAAKDDIENRYVTVYGAKSGVHVPIVVGGKVMGDLALVSKREKAHFTEEHVSLLQALSNFSALALDRA